MVSLRTLTLFAGLAFPAMSQFPRLLSPGPTANPLGRAVHSFVAQNAQVPALPDPPARPPARLAPRKMVSVAPGNRYLAQPLPDKKCSIPLLDALSNRPQMQQFGMPTLNPRLDIDPRIHVPPPAPPCKEEK
jgi:hypothetical protein